MDKTHKKPSERGSKKNHCCGPGRRGPRSIEFGQWHRPVSAAQVADIVTIEAGASHVGTDAPVLPADGEAPRRAVELRSFAIARTCVTNAEFAAFVAATGHETEAERYGNSFVFGFMPEYPSVRAFPAVVGAPWWHLVEEACWRRPYGKGSSVEGKTDHPVVHVSLADAEAYASWAGGRLPSEAEWERAAHANRNVIFPWGDSEPTPDKPQCKIWYGPFPTKHDHPEIQAGTCPVDAYPPNPLGLHNMVGNVWEWTSDRFEAHTPSMGTERPAEHVLKGGSHLCHRSYCHRYRIAARMGRPADTTTSHIGFRLAFDITPRGSAQPGRKV